MNTLLVFLCISLFLSFDLTAQTDAIGYETKYSDDYPDAEAIYLQKDMSVSFYFERGEEPKAIYSFKERIKVLSEKGMTRGDVEIFCRRGFAKEEVYRIKGVVYNKQANGEINKDKLLKENIYEEVHTHYTATKFAMPNVQVGSIIELEYKISSLNVYTIKRHFFQTDIPVVNSVMSVEIPQKLAYTPIHTGEHLIVFSEMENSLEVPRTTTFTMKAKDIPPILEDEYVLNVDDHRTSLKYELHTFYYDNGTKDVFAKSWDALAKELNGHKDFGKQLKKKIRQLNPIIETAKQMSLEDRVKYIYDYVRVNYAWNEEIGILADEGIYYCISKGTGNVADLNLLLTNLLLKCGVDAKPVILKTRSRGILNTDYPSLTEPNYVIVEVDISGKKIYLDGTSKNIPYGQLPERAINTAGVSMYKKKSEIISFTNPNKYKSQNFYDLSFTSNERLQGVNKAKLSDYAATVYRLKVNEIYNDDQPFSSNSYVMDKEIEVSNLDDINAPIVFEQNISLTSNVDNIEDKLILGAFIKDILDEEMFKESKRDYPLYFNYEVDMKYVFKIEKPEGYEIESQPENFSFALSNNDAVFHYEVKDIADYFIINYSIKISKMEYSANEYSALKKFIDLVLDKQSEKLILSK